MQFSTSAQNFTGSEMKKKSSLPFFEVTERLASIYIASRYNCLIGGIMYEEKRPSPRCSGRRAFQHAAAGARPREARISAISEIPKRSDHANRLTAGARNRDEFSSAIPGGSRCTQALSRPGNGILVRIAHSACLFFVLSHAACRQKAFPRRLARFFSP